LKAGSNIGGPLVPAICGGTPVRLKKIQPGFFADEKTRSAVNLLLDGGSLGDFYGGPFANEFESRFVEATGSSNAIAVNTGTAALHVAISSLDVRPGDEVLVPDTCFFTAATVVLQENAVPIPIDCEPGSFDINLQAAEAAITDRTAAIITAHMYGIPGDLDAQKRFAERHKIAWVEDACQALGARFRGQLAGTLGTMGCFSFASPRKHIVTGEGGMVITADANLAQLARMIANKGKANGWYTHQRMGYSYALPEFAAIVGLQGLRDLDGEVKRRRLVATQYDRILGSGCFLAGLASRYPLSERSGTLSSYFRYPIVLDEQLAPLRDWIVRAIEAENVSAKPPHSALHEIPWLAEKGFRDSHRRPSRTRVPWRDLGPQDFPNASRLLSRTIDLETGPCMDELDGGISAQAVDKVVSWAGANYSLAVTMAADSGRY
jgi:perosamine synthetase